MAAKKMPIFCGACYNQRMKKRVSPTITFNAGRRGSNILELLLALAILSVSMYPIVYIFRIATPAKQKTQTEYMATLLAQHAMESIVARRLIDPDYLPTMSDPEPVVQSSDSVANVSPYFRGISEKGENFNEADDAPLYWSLKQFNCQIDTYYLEGDIFKVIVYVSYQKDGRNMKVFFERLLSRTEKDEADILE